MRRALSDQFVWPGGISCLIGLVFLIWPRAVEGGMEAWFSIVSRSSRAPRGAASVRIVGLLFLCIGAFSFCMDSSTRPRRLP